MATLDDINKVLKDILSISKSTQRQTLVSAAATGKSAISGSFIKDEKTDQVEFLGDVSEGTANKLFILGKSFTKLTRVINTASRDLSKKKVTAQVPTGILTSGGGDALPATVIQRVKAPRVTGGLAPTGSPIASTKSAKTAKIAETNGVKKAAQGLGKFAKVLGAAAVGLGLLVAGIALVSKGISSFKSEISKLSEFNAGIAGIAAQHELRGIQRNISSGEFRKDTLARMQDSVDDILDILEPVTDLMLVVLNGILEIARIILTAILDIGLLMAELIPGEGPIEKRLKEIKESIEGNSSKETPLNRLGRDVQAGIGIKKDPLFF